MSNNRTPLLCFFDLVCPNISIRNDRLFSKSKGEDGKRRKAMEERKAEGCVENKQETMGILSRVERKGGRGDVAEDEKSRLGDGTRREWYAVQYSTVL